MPWRPAKYSSCSICSKDQKEDFTASVEFGFLFKKEYLKWLCQHAPDQFSSQLHKYWSLYLTNLTCRERKNVQLFYNPSFLLQKSIRLIFCYTYLTLLIFSLFCFTKRNKNVFSERLFMSPFLSQSPRSDCCCVLKFISTGKQSRFSNTFAKFKHENTSVHYISM